MLIGYAVMLNLIQHLAADPEPSPGWRSSRHWWAVTNRLLTCSNYGIMRISHPQGGATWSLCITYSKYRDRCRASSP